MEFNNYNTAKSKYISGLNIKKMPLVSWNFHAENMVTINKIVSDAHLLNEMAEANNWSQNWDLKQELQDLTVIVVTCPKLKIVFASQNIMKMNGYKPEEVIGNSPKMFQGVATDTAVSKEISHAVSSHLAFEKVIINYKKDGSLYKCHIKGFPVFNSKGELKNFIAFEKAA